jgi:glycosyltransferase involved in cell wall biosynthesis
MISRPPLVTVGMPLYNSARHLPKAMDALLGQTFRDFEILISDNASTDGTVALCEEYAVRDSRVRLIRQPRNIGAPRNWNAVVPGARGKYFKWASGNDYCAPETLDLCVQALEADPGLVLCYGRTELIDDEGAPIGPYASDIDALQASPSERFGRICRHLDLNNAQQALVRTDVLKLTGLDRLYPGGDLALTAELALYGRFLLLPRTLLYRRHGRGSVMAMRSPAEVQRIYNPQASAPMKLIRGRLHWDHFASVARAPIPFAEKARAWRLALRHAKWDRENLVREFMSLLMPSLSQAHT